MVSIFSEYRSSSPLRSLLVWRLPQLMVPSTRIKFSGLSPEKDYRIGILFQQMQKMGRSNGEWIVDPNQSVAHELTDTVYSYVGTQKGEIYNNYGCNFGNVKLSTSKDLPKQLKDTLFVENEFRYQQLVKIEEIDIETAAVKSTTTLPIHHGDFVVQEACVVDDHIQTSQQLVLSRRRYVPSNIRQKESELIAKMLADWKLLRLEKPHPARSAYQYFEKRFIRHLNDVDKSLKESMEETKKVFEALRDDEKVEWIRMENADKERFDKETEEFNEGKIKIEQDVWHAAETIEQMIEKRND